MESAKPIHTVIESFRRYLRASLPDGTSLLNILDETMSNIKWKRVKGHNNFSHLFLGKFRTGDVYVHFNVKPDGSIPQDFICKVYCREPVPNSNSRAPPSSNTPSKPTYKRTIISQAQCPEFKIIEPLSELFTGQTGGWNLNTHALALIEYAFLCQATSETSGKVFPVPSPAKIYAALKAIHTARQHRTQESDQLFNVGDSAIADAGSTSQDHENSGRTQGSSSPALPGGQVQVDTRTSPGSLTQSSSAASVNCYVPSLIVLETAVNSPWYHKLPELNKAKFRHCQKTEGYVPIKMEVGRTEDQETGDWLVVWAFMRHPNREDTAGAIEFVAHGIDDWTVFVELPAFIAAHPFSTVPHHMIHTLVRYFFIVAANATDFDMSGLHEPMNKTFKTQLRSICQKFEDRSATGAESWKFNIREEDLEVWEEYEAEN
ncbi:hypothetical protein BDV96DRAFT_646377 [Lophiotrema nucula]|uniref:Uncharacterized protein n=1 Tax=Lophiotrema nucula TaxID=690887 RepID=A0A6A5Z7I2_9PLEO|nr:hypothetical protein BDV96DRAFT_646377 [Lophiotrema nucula]